MKRRGSSPGPLRRSGLIAVVLLITFLLMGGMAWQAYDTARSHRETSERVLADYATLAAEVLVRRSTVEVGYNGYFAVSSALAARPEPWTAPLPTVQDLARAPVEGGEADPLTTALSLVRTILRFRPGAEPPLEISGPRPAPEVERWLIEGVEAALRAGPGDYPLVVLTGQPGGSFHTAVWTLPRAAAEPAMAVGFEVEPAALPECFARALARGSLLPASLTGGEAGDELVSVRVLAPDGREIFRSPPPPGLAEAGGGPRVRVPFGDAYQGMLDGWVVEAEIPPGAAEKLVIGGLPRSRLPQLLLLLALAAGLVATALIQLGRERELTRLRADFVSRVSHELRTPLTQIRIFTETLLLDRVRSPEERRRSLEVIDREARRLSHLVENILQFSRGDRGVVRLAPRRRELAPLIAEMLNEFEPLATDGAAGADRARLTSRLLPGVEAFVDADALRQILLNLLDNAVKYGPPGQQVRVGMTEVAGGVHLRVEDEGPGIPREERERIWEGFRRLERDRSSAVAGTGIGLAVVRELVTLHGGRAWVEPGERGARFVVELPTEAPAESVEEVEP